MTASACGSFRTGSTRLRQREAFKNGSPVQTIIFQNRSELRPSNVQPSFAHALLANPQGIQSLNVTIRFDKDIRRGLIAQALHLAAAAQDDPYNVSHVFDAHL